MATGTSSHLGSEGSQELEDEAVRNKPVRERALSSITKLLVQGIRGFGPNDEQKAVIEFGKPLTLITGQNGAGKTTIIECLKYVTTGELPPNTKGGAFVHDPKLVNERSVRGVVKLKFQNIAGDNVVCHRILQSTQKPKKIEQKALDSSLSKIMPGGEKTKITTRCADINREMIDQLGVSKAILTHVIFCHQEEAAWPLSEGKALKLKFDDIFASTRYTKALENFRKISQDLNSEIRIYKAELHHLTKQKEKVDEVKANLQEAQRKVDNSKLEITRVRNELGPLEIRLQDLTNQYDEVTQIEKDITMHESSRKELVRSQQQLESRLEQAFTGSKAELREERERHSDVVKRNTNDLDDCKRKLSKLVKSMESMKTQLDREYKEQGRLKTEEQYHKDRLASRDRSLLSAAGELGLADYKQGALSEAKVEQFLQEFSQHRTREKKKADEEKGRLLKKEREAQDKLNQLRSNLAKIEEGIELKRNNIRDNRSKAAAITKELASIGSGAAALEGVEQDLETAEKELGDYHASVSLSGLEEELEVWTQEKQKLGGKLSQLQKEMSQLSMYSSARGAIDGLKKQKKEKEDSYQLELGGVEPELLSLLGVMPGLEEDLTECVRRLVKDKEREKQAAGSRLSQALAKMSRFQAQHEELEKQVQEKKARATGLQQEVTEVCGEETSNSYQEMVDALQQKINTASDNISTVKGSQSFFRKSLEKLHSSHKCPLCMRGFDQKEALDSTVKLITTRLNEAIPRMIPRLDAELRQLQDQQKRLQELKPKIEELSHIRVEEVPQRQAALEEKAKMVADTQATVDREKAAQAQLQTELEHLRSLEPKVSKVTQLKEQLKELKGKILSEEKKLGHVQGSSQQRSQHVVNRELMATQRSIEEFGRKMDDKRQEITETQRMERQLEGRVHALKEERLQLQSQLQKRETLLSKKSDLTTQIAAWESEVKLEVNRVGPVREKMEGLEVEKEDMVRVRGEAEAKAWAELEQLKVTFEGIKRRSDTINKYLQDGCDKAVEECEARVETLTEQVRAKTSEKKAVEDKMATLTKDLANAKNKERELEDNLQLMKQREEIELKERRVKQLRDKLQQMGLEQYDEEFQRLQADVERLRKECARAEGHKLGQEDQVRHLQKELQGDLYANTEQRHMDMLIKLKTTETAGKDLIKYYKALDRAITRFHQEKMKEINQIIRELWIKTYKGRDIDRIEVRSDDGATEGAGIATRRVYNYRVAMLKGSAELDMRGRCSAGQKVLASIIIRLALAETFCLTSGLLALDEPTTNLDRDNVEGLAQALIDIIKARSENQKNFQLIIITHDEAFVELLGHAGYTDCFYRVTKKFGETSKIGRYFF